jgi:hypothetical protein
MNAMIKPQVAMPGRAAIESVEVILVAIPVIGSVAANNDWFEDWASDLLEFPEHDQLTWVEEKSGIEDTWSRVEDLWLRLARHPGVSCTSVSDPVQGGQLLMFRIQGGAVGFEGMLMLEVAGRSSTYQWREEGRLGSLVSGINWCGDTLVIDIPSFQQVRACLGGDGLVFQMQALMRSLRQTMNKGNQKIVVGQLES